MSKVSSALEFLGLKSKEEMAFQNLTLAAYLQGKITNKELRRRVHLAHIKAANTRVKTDIDFYHQMVKSEADTDRAQKGYRTNLLNLSRILTSSDGAIKKDQEEILKQVLKYFDFNATCYEDNHENETFLKYGTLSSMASAPRKGLLFSLNNISTKNEATVTLKPFENGEAKDIVTFTVSDKNEAVMLSNMLASKAGVFVTEYQTLTNENYFTLMTIAKKYRSDVKFPVDASAHEVFLASSCKAYLSQKKQLDGENFSILDTDIHNGSLIDDVQQYITIELNKKRSEKGRVALTAIKKYLEEFKKLASETDQSKFEKALSSLDTDLTEALKGIVKNRTWASYFWSFYSPVPKIVSLVTQYKEDITNHIKQKIEEAAAADALKVQSDQNEADLEAFKLQKKTDDSKDYGNTIASLRSLGNTDQLRKLQEIVKVRWNGQDISKEDFENTLASIERIISHNKDSLSNLETCLCS